MASGRLVLRADRGEDRERNRGRSGKCSVDLPWSSRSVGPIFENVSMRLSRCPIRRSDVARRDARRNEAIAHKRTFPRTSPADRSVVHKKEPTELLDRFARASAKERSILHERPSLRVCTVRAQDDGSKSRLAQGRTWRPPFPTHPDSSSTSPIVVACARARSRTPPVLANIRVDSQQDARTRNEVRSIDVFRKPTNFSDT